MKEEKDRQRKKSDRKEKGVAGGRFG